MSEANDGKDLEKFLYEFEGWLDDLPWQVQWFDTFIATGKLIQSGGDSPFLYEVFFTKLYGIVTETDKFIFYHFLPGEVIDELNKLFSVQQQLSVEYMDMAKAAHQLCLGFKKNLIDEELEIVEFLRVKACHLVSEGFIVSRTGSSKHDFNYLRNGELKSNLRIRIEANLVKYGGAKAFALRCFRDFERPAGVFRDLLMQQCVRHSLKSRN